MKPRQILKGATYMVTRRTTQGMFLLKPSREVNGCIRYCVALAQRRSKVAIHSLTFLSNHYHIVLTDVEGRLPVFTEELNKLLARALNSHLKRTENFWESGPQTSQVLLVDADDVLAKTVYTLANPTAALLVARGSEWPGVLLFRRGRYLGKRPAFFFRDETSDGALPKALHIQLTPPPIGQDAKNCDDIVKVAVQAREKELRAQAKTAKRRFLGAASVLAQSPFDAPRHAKQRRVLSPQVACRDRLRRIEVLAQLRRFRMEHESCRVRVQSGESDVVFPAGTFRFVQHFGARCADV